MWGYELMHHEKGLISTEKPTTVGFVGFLGFSFLGITNTT